jgi:hypothetical protein
MTHCNADCEFILEYAPGTPLEQLLKGREILLEQVRPFPLAK